MSLISLEFKTESCETYQLIDAKDFEVFEQELHVVQARFRGSILGKLRLSEFPDELSPT